MLGVAGLASAAALTTAMLPSVTPQPEAPVADQGLAAAVRSPSRPSGTSPAT